MTLDISEPKQPTTRPSWDGHCFSCNTTTRTQGTLFGLDSCPNCGLPLHAVYSLYDPQGSAAN